MSETRSEWIGVFAKSVKFQLGDDQAAVRSASDSLSSDGSKLGMAYMVSDGPECDSTLEASSSDEMLSENDDEEEDDNAMNIDDLECILIPDSDALLEDSVQFFLGCGVPIFFLHEYESTDCFVHGSNMFEEHRQRQVRMGWLADDLRQRLLNNIFDKLALDSRCKILSPSDPASLTMFVLPRLPRLGVIYKAGSWLSGHSRTFDTVYAPPPPVPVDCDKAAEQHLAELVDHISKTSHVYTDDEDSDDDDYPAKLPSKPLVTKDRPMSPPIASFSGAKWTTYLGRFCGPDEDEEDNTMSLKAKSHKLPMRIKEMWYDRQHGRCLAFDRQLQAMDRMIPDSEDEWGRPLPDFHHHSESQKTYNMDIYNEGSS